jgi:glycosyltransferase involved in cell wall biosynthesis
MSAQRVLFVTGEYPPMHGGVGDYTARLAEALAQQGWDAAILTSARAAGSRFVVATVARWGWGLSRLVRQAARDTGAALIHLQYQTGAFAMHPAVNRLPDAVRDWPLVTTFHDLRAPYLFPKAGPLRAWLNRSMARGSAAVIVTNPEDAAGLGRDRQLQAQVHWIPIGSNLPQPSGADPRESRRQLGVPLDRLAVGFFGFLTRDKGIDLLLVALESLPEPRPALVLVGGGLADTDRANAEYLSWIGQRLVESTVPVIQIGYRPPQEAADLLSALDLVVLPFRAGASLRNGTLVAALACGAAVVTTAPARSEWLHPLRDREHLWLVPPGEPEALQSAIATLLTDRGARERLRRAARLASRAFAWDEIARRHIGLYETILARRGRARGDR